ncbi:MAG: hypothetical protein M0P72_07500, partial [Metallibacterium scheffleri]|uniref:hypothetical protein n=1 Tax=Metallibacterium scheffleri TaxID=993689 RepID=UPI0026F143C1
RLSFMCGLLLAVDCVVCTFSLALDAEGEEESIPLLRVDSVEKLGSGNALTTVDQASNVDQTLRCARCVRPTHQAGTAFPISVPFGANHSAILRADRTHRVQPIAKRRLKNQRIPKTVEIH